MRRSCSPGSCRWPRRKANRSSLLVVPGVDPFEAMVQTAANLKASRLVTGVSARMASEELARLIGQAWERLPEPRHPFSLEIITPGRPSVFVNLGPHPPRLWPEDIELLHDMWLKLSHEVRRRAPPPGHRRGGPATNEPGTTFGSATRYSFGRHGGAAAKGTGAPEQEEEQQKEEQAKGTE